MMKKYYLFFLVFLNCFCVMFGQTTLGNGDVVITGFNADNPDQFSFVLLTDVTVGTEIRFTDNGWEAAGQFRTGEGILVWTATTDLPCGTEIVVDDQSPFVVTQGVITDSPGFALAIAGDQILVYQGTEVAPVFIYAINFDSAGWSDAISANTTALPSGLTDSVDAVDLDEIDNAKYDCSVTADASLILSAVSNVGNWDLDNITPYIMGGCTYNCLTCSITTTWNGLAWDNGFPNFAKAAILTGDYFMDATNPSFSTCSLTVNTGSTLTINDNYYVVVENDIIVDGTLNVTTSGSVVQNSNVATVTENGDITVTKQTALLDVWYEYTYWSSPVTNETVGTALSQSQPSRRFTFNAQNFEDSFRETNNDGTQVPGQDDIDDDGNDWTYANNADAMTPGVGFAATHAENLFIGPPMSSPPYQFDYVFSGPFNNGDISVPVFRNDAQIADINWNFIGNPYPSAIDVDLFLNENVSVNGILDGALYLWSQYIDASPTENGNEQLNFSQSDYALINGAGTTAGGDGVIPSRYIPSGQGFFVSFSDALPSNTGNVIFKNDMRVTGNNSQFFRSSNNSTDNKVWVNLTSDNGVFNQLMVSYIEGATNAFDGFYYDAPRNLSTGANSILYSIIENNDKKFAIQGRDPSSLNEDEVIPLGFYTSIDVPTLYSLSIAQFEGDFFENHPIYIKDQLLNEVHLLSESDYVFTSETGEFNDRFEIVFNASSLSIDDISINSSELIISELSNGDVKISVNKGYYITKIEILDLLGRKIYDFNGDSSSEIIDLSKISRSAYLARVSLSNGQVITKKAIKQY